MAHIYFTCDGVGDEVVYLFGFMVEEVGDRVKRSAIRAIAQVALRPALRSLNLIAQLAVDQWQSRPQLSLYPTPVLSCAKTSPPLAKGRGKGWGKTNVELMVKRDC